jgi:hypothetical protein
MALEELLDSLYLAYMILQGERRKVLAVIANKR